MNAFVSVLGMDQKGIIKEVATALTECEINIVDINQTIVDGYFSMVMRVDLVDCPVEFKNIKRVMDMVGDRMNLKIKVQHEELFTAMHQL